MGEIGLRDLFKVILIRKKIIIFTILVFIAANLTYVNFFLKPLHKTTALIKLSNYQPKKAAESLLIYRSPVFLSRVQERLNLSYEIPAPKLILRENNALEITIEGFFKNTSEICNALLHEIEGQEKHNYEEEVGYYKEKIKPLEDKISIWTVERNRTLELAERIVTLIGTYEPRPRDEIPALISQNIYYNRVREIEDRIDALEKLVNENNEAVRSLSPPLIIQNPIEEKFPNLPTNLSKKAGAILSGFVGLAIGILIVLLLEYNKV